MDHRPTKGHTVSVVIATLGDDILQKTIAQLNKGSVVPEEILVCIPNEYANRVKKLSYPNMKIIETSVRGQVVQRIEGFKQATGKYVIQLDDDVNVDKNCIERLINTLIENGLKTCAGPSYYSLASKKSAYFVNKKKWLKNIYYWILNGKEGYKPGVITKSGVNIGVDTENEKESNYIVEWLAGGCVAHYRGNLIVDNYYPYPGKAYAEDIIHSLLLTQKGCTLIYDTTAHCGFEMQQVSDQGIWRYLKTLLSDYKARRYYAKISGKSIFRLNVFYFALFINHIIRTVIHAVLMPFYKRNSIKY